MPELIYQTIPEDRESKNYRLFRYLLKKHNAEIADFIEKVHLEIVDPGIDKIIGWKFRKDKED